MSEQKLSDMATDKVRAIEVWVERYKGLPIAEYPQAFSDGWEARDAEVERLQAVVARLTTESEAKKQKNQSIDTWALGTGWS